MGHADRELSLKFREGKMGRTVTLYSQIMESERERLKPFRGALSKEDQQAFDRLFDRAKMHTSAGVYMASPWPMDTILLSFCQEQGKRIYEIPACPGPGLSYEGGKGHAPGEPASAIRRRY